MITGFPASGESLITYLKGQNLLYVRPRDVFSLKDRMSVEMYYAPRSRAAPWPSRPWRETAMWAAPGASGGLLGHSGGPNHPSGQVEMSRLQKVFADYELSPGFLEKLGPAINSGRSIFLFGPSGNGKTIISTTIGHAFQDEVYIPFALYVNGQIIRMFDELNHQVVAPTVRSPSMIPLGAVPAAAGHRRWRTDRRLFGTQV